MLFRNKDFRPDKTEEGILSRIHLTRQQRYRILRWVLMGGVLLALSLVQDVIMSRVRFLGGTTSLLPAGIFIACMLMPAEEGSLFALLGAAFFYYSGASAGPQVIAVITALAILFSIFRHSYMKKGFLSNLVCGATVMMLYGILIFAIELFLGNTIPSRFSAALAGSAMSVAAMPLLYPIFASIEKIGGETWKD